MKRIYKLLSDIHDEVGQADGGVDQNESLLVGLDTAEDAAEALLNYETQRLGNSQGEKYLRLYGMLQAVVLQQDGIRQIWKSLMPGVEAPPSEAWMRLRELRNMKAGHPVSYGRDKHAKSNQKHIFIHRVTIDDVGFRYEIAAKNEKPEYVDVDLGRMYEGYKNEACTLLEKMITSMGRAD